MDALRMMGLGATPLPASVVNYQIPVPANVTADVPWWQKALSTAEKVFEVGKPIVDQLNIGKGGGAFNPGLSTNNNPVIPPAPTFWDQHGTKVLVGGGLALAAGTGIYFATRPKKKK